MESLIILGAPGIMTLLKFGKLLYTYNCCHVNSAVSDQTPRSVASGMSLNCLSVASDMSLHCFPTASDLGIH